MLSIWLYGKPSWDLPLEGRKQLNPQTILIHGIYLQKHLSEVSSFVEKLQSNNWLFSETYGESYSIEFYKEISLDDAQKEMSSLGIPLHKITLEEI